MIGTTTTAAGLGLALYVSLQAYRQGGLFAWHPFCMSLGGLGLSTAGIQAVRSRRHVQGIQPKTQRVKVRPNRRHLELSWTAGQLSCSSSSTSSRARFVAGFSMFAPRRGWSHTRPDTAVVPGTDAAAIHPLLWSHVRSRMTRSGGLGWGLRVSHEHPELAEGSALVFAPNYVDRLVVTALLPESV